MRAPLLLILSFFLSLFTLPVVAQTQQEAPEVSFTAYADAKEVLLNTYFELTLTLKNAESRNITPPDLRDFRVLSGPNAGFQTSIINGRMTQQTTYTYRLQALRTGTLTIGSAAVKVTLQTLERGIFSRK